MPTVPKYEPNVRIAPLIQQGFSVRASGDDFGAAIGRGMGDVASGLNKAAQAAVFVKELEGEAEAKQADNGYAAWEREAMYGQNGYMNLEGQAAVAARAEFEKTAATKRQEFGSGLTGFGSKAYERASTARLNSILDRTITHQASERKTWMKQASADRVATFADDALASYQNPALVQKNIDAGLAEIRSMAALAGLDEDSLKLREDQFRSGVHKNVALRMAQTDPSAALEYATAHKDDFDGDALTDLEGVLAPVIIDQKSRQEAERIMSAGRAPSGEGTLGAAGPTRALANLKARAIGGATRADALTNLDANFAINLDAIIEDAPDSIKAGLGLTSGYRSTEKQAELYAANQSGSVAEPGGSSHEYGLAVDLTWNGKLIKRGEVPDEVIDYLHNNAAAYGLNFRLKDASGAAREDWHVEPMDARQRIAGGATVSARGTGVAPRSTMPSASEQLAALDAIDNPMLREETARRLKLITDIRDAEAKEQFARLQSEAFAMIDQGQSPDAMDPQMRAQLGRDEMAGLWSYYEARRKGTLATDEKTLYGLQTEYAKDPAAFAQRDLWEVRDKLSDADWEKVTGWRQTALTDGRKASTEATAIVSTSDMMRTQLDQVGITTTGKTGKERDEAARREAQFQIALQREVDAATKANNGVALKPTEVQSIINRLLLPVVIKDPGTFYDSETNVRLFEVPNLGNVGGNKTAALYSDYAEIPQADRISIEMALEQRLGFKPSEEQVEAEYAAFLSAQFNTGP